jgi:hypothetical protein
MLRQQQMAALQKEREQLETVNRLYGEAFALLLGVLMKLNFIAG